MRNGPKNRRVSFWIPPTDLGTRGQRSGSWTKIAEASAEVIETASREFERARKSFEPATMVFRISFPRNFTPTTQMRVHYDGQVFEVGFVYDPDQRKRELIIAASGMK